jgi:hypothetical protein
VEKTGRQNRRQVTGRAAIFRTGEEEGWAEAGTEYVGFVADSLEENDANRG